MNLNNYYLHAIKDNKFYPSKDAIKKLESILEKNNILSRRLQNYKSNYLSFNGLDYISLCDPSKPREGYSAFNYFIKTSLSLVISKDINIINPKIINVELNKPIYDIETLSILDNENSIDKLIMKKKTS